MLKEKYRCQANSSFSLYFYALSVTSSTNQAQKESSLYQLQARKNADSKKQTVFDLAQSSTSATIGEGSKRKVESISTSEEADRSPSTQDENPRKKPNVQSTSPLQK
ncbi:hypothetical protein A4A49_00595 [Nicotiana attenuata]|uniref:Uncharacterized protein n=1 Tax=Nicotiana attenuata TaxID=49451 RepID=A0A1J6I9U7_NICAT|nr:hypothetical protein A4A49_00595 [Nicotiana attenuata]